MSYDLYFTSPRISRDEFEAYFNNRPNYKITDGQAFYENPVTGVYFSFDFNDGPPLDEDDIGHSVVFNINFYRPHYFILEAEPEVSELISAFGFTIYDPQIRGMEVGPYSTEGLIEGWDHGNEFSYSTILGGDNAPRMVYARPRMELEAIWRWNLLTELRMAQSEKDIFIPRIMFAEVDSCLMSFCVWPDAISTLLPRVDSLWIPRQALAPRKNEDDLCLIPFDAALTVLAKYAVKGYELPAYEQPSPKTPPEVHEFIRGLSPFTRETKGVAMDAVLTMDLVEKYRGNLPIR